jgi:hypothetical protein
VDLRQVSIRGTRQAGNAGVRVRFGEDADKPDADTPRYSGSVEFRLCFNNVSRASLARLLSSMHTRPVRAPGGGGAEKLSGSASGTVADLAAKYALLVE